MRKRVFCIMAFVGAVASYVALLFFLLPRLVDSIPLGTGEVEEARISLGVTAFEAARELERQGFVSNAHVLARWMAKMGIDRKLKPGLYRIRRGTPWEVARQLASSEAEQLQVTLIPGLDADELAHLLPYLERDDLFPQDLRSHLPKDAIDRIVFLLPETYQIVPGEDEKEQLISQASKLWTQRVGTSVLSPEELRRRGILASIIEKEIRFDEERPLAASVFLNRIRKGMALQSCATVVFAWKSEGRHLSRLSLEDLKIDSPFNTYLHRGLPPHPISLPSRSSWKGALAPVESDFLFFVAKGDGSHVFTKTYKEHLEAQRN